MQPIRQEAATRPWRTAWQRAGASGSAAAVFSAAALAWRGYADEGSAAGPLNGPSQWIWGETQAYRRDATIRTAVGYAIHHSTAILWATLYERLLGEQRHPKSIVRHLAEASSMTAAAYIVDYHFTPSRFRPGFKKHLQPASVFAVYAAFAAGLALTQIVRGSRR